MSTTLEYIKEYASIIRSATKEYVISAISSIEYFMEAARESFKSGLNYAYSAIESGITFISNFPQYIVESTTWFFQVIWQGIVSGYNAAFNFSLGLVNAAVTAFNFTVFLLKQLPALISSLFDFIFESVQLLFKVVSLFWAALCFLTEQLWSLTKAAISALLELTWNICKELPGAILSGLAKAVGMVLGVCAAILDACKALPGIMLDYLAKTVGVVFGISAAAVDLAGDLVDYVVSKTTGVELNNNPVFDTIKTGLSILVAAVGIYQIARYTYGKLAPLFKRNTTTAPDTEDDISPDQEAEEPTISASPVRPITVAYDNTQSRIPQDEPAANSEEPTRERDLRMSAG